MVVLRALAGYGQNEYVKYTDGLVYRDSTKNRLIHIADSLNTRFGQGAFNKQYYSVPQGIASSIHMIKGKYPAADTATNRLLTKTAEQRSATCSNTYYWLQGPDDIHPPFIYITVSAPCDPYAHMGGPTGVKGNWVYNYSSISPDGRGGLTAFYITQAPESKPIPHEYAEMMRYADCLLDTTSQVFYPNALNSGDIRDLIMYAKNARGGQELAFLNHFHNDTAHLVKRYGMVVPEKMEWLYRDSLLKSYICDSLATQPAFRLLVAGAAEEILRTKAVTDNTFEYCVSVCYSKEAALALKRNRLDDDECGNAMGMGHRMHCHNIAVLAAETANWPVFLRARLDVMNDVVDRDLASARHWRRASHVNELEDLHIDVPQLMLGLSLAKGNAAKVHYPYSIGMFGQACAETSHPKAMEKKLLDMMSDPRLDNYNRLLMRYLFLKIVFFLPDKEDRLACLQDLQEADKTLPLCIAPRAKVNQRLFEQGVAGR